MYFCSGFSDIITYGKKVCVLQPTFISSASLILELFSVSFNERLKIFAVSAQAIKVSRAGMRDLQKENKIVSLLNRALCTVCAEFHHDSRRLVPTCYFFDKKDIIRYELYTIRVKKKFSFPKIPVRHLYPIPG